MGVDWAKTKSPLIKMMTADEIAIEQLYGQRPMSSSPPLFILLDRKQHEEDYHSITEVPITTQKERSRSTRQIQEERVRYESCFWLIDSDNGTTTQCEVAYTNDRDWKESWMISMDNEELRKVKYEVKGQNNCTLTAIEASCCFSAFFFR